ncbi:TIGR01777 family oxidoreductase [Mesoterricola sediminis]|uniref:Epimerase n=1 Tax=Mesoterricola sediminis TaxID=2927980 RepID=A0AA48GVJ5_9BACT|nr:TIGR01777 family oxidoreductase [Mesoterricola sediminis]BDU77054.1 epimerase [Mesoterricola sediminis]
MDGLKQVVLAGGTGLVGRHLRAALAAAGTRVTLLTRNPAATPGAVGWDALPGVLEGADAVINLAGEGIADQRWSPDRKRALIDSRVDSTRRITAALAQAAAPPPVLVNASATGFYGNRDDRPVDESAPSGTGFLAEVCRAWEAAADTAPAGVRVVKLRIGVVLARDGGALSKMALPVRLFQGAKLGDGRQGLSWIHIDDLVAMVLEAARNPAWAGAVNAVAPAPLSNEAFTRALARTLHRPVLPVPAFLTRAAVKLLVGEMADEMLLGGVHVVPARAQALGFTFRYPHVDAALPGLLT